MRFSGSNLELVVAGLVALLGMAATTYGALNHGGPLVAPGSALILLGGAWLGNALARMNIHLFPVGAPGEPTVEVGEE